MSFRKTLAVGSASILIPISAASIYYRPIPNANEPIDILAERAHVQDPFLIALGRKLVHLTGAVFAKGLIQVFNRFELKKDENYYVFLNSIKNRGKNVPLLTVSNHASPLDDPCLLGAVIPLPMAALKPELLRFSICAREICFKNAALSTFFSLSKVMPIIRGDGIDQKMFRLFQGRLAAGSWCHIFPEGQCFQIGALSGRKGSRRQEIGRLKWGVGKLIAHSPVRPIVVPIFHTGMQNLMPLDPITRKSIHFWPRIGNVITARCGPRIDVSDLIDAHERKFGKLEAYSTTSNSRESGRESTEAELALYSAITRKIEEALLKLEWEARSELKERFPTFPKEVRETFKECEFDPETGYKKDSL